jgi:hypothetical protein
LPIANTLLNFESLERSDHGVTKSPAIQTRFYVSNPASLL